MAPPKGRKRDGKQDRDGDLPPGTGAAQGGPPQAPGDEAPTGTPAQAGPPGVPPPGGGGGDGSPRPRPGPRYEYARIEPSPAAVAALGLAAAGRMERGPAARPRETTRPAGAGRPVPVYGPVDRSVPIEPFAQDVRVPPEGSGPLLFIVRRYYGDPAGPLPGDPGHVPVYVESRTAVCYSLPPRGASRCLGRGGYF